MSKVAVYGNYELPLPDHATEDQARAAMASIYSEVQEADVRVEGDKIIFEVKAGVKGSDSEGRVAVYGNYELPLPPHATEDQARAAMSSIYSEVQEADVRTEGNKIIFEVKAGVKGN